MAKYTIHHVCGHKCIIQLYGPHFCREIKIKKMERRDCPKCWSEKQQSKENDQPITVTVGFTMSMSSDVQPIFEIVLRGGTKKRKEELKMLGYRWRDACGGVLGLISGAPPQKAWIKRASWGSLHLELSKIKSIVDKIQHRLSDADFAVMEKQIDDILKGGCDA